jgi:hypothetical protein
MDFAVRPIKRRESTQYGDTIIVSIAEVVVKYYNHLTADQALVIGKARHAFFFFFTKN